MKKFLVVFLVIGLLFGGSMNVFANGKGNGAAKNSSTEVVDGRNGNSDKNGTFDLVISDGPYFTEDSLIVIVNDLIIDGPIDTLVVTANDVELSLTEFGYYEVDLELPSTPGDYPIIVEAITKFKNGQKDGLIHTKVKKETSILVLEKPTGELPVATSLESRWNSEKNSNNTVEVSYSIDIDGEMFYSTVNFNKHDRDRGFKIITKNDYTFRVNYLAP